MGRDVRIDQATPADWRVARTLRLAALADAPDAFGSTLAEEADQPDAFWHRRLQIESVITLIAWVDREPVGLSVVAPVHDQPGAAGLYSVWVAPEARRVGVGQVLVGEAIEVARDGGYDRLVLDVGDHNRAAIGLYARMGFARTGRTSTLPPPRTHVTEHERAVELTR